MKLTRREIVQKAGGLVLASAALLAGRQNARAQDAGAATDANMSDYMDAPTAFLRSLVPEESDLQGFLRQGFRQTRPAGQIGTMYLDQFPAKPIPDILQFDVDPATPPLGGLKAGRVSSLQRGFYSSDTFWHIGLEVYSCDSIPTAQKYILAATRRTQAVWRKGTLLNTAAIGDESWITDGAPANDPALWLRFGAIVARVEAGLTGSAEAYGLTLQTPPSLVEAVAHMILLRAARASFLSHQGQPHGPLKPGESDWSVLVRVDGEMLPRHSCQQVGDQIYVPVLLFADAAHQDMQARWDGSAGALLLMRSPYMAVTLAAGSAIVKEGPPTKTTLKVPLLKDGGQPYLALSDLLSLLPRAKMQPEGDGVSVQASAF